MVSTYIPVFEPPQPNIRSLNNNELAKEKLTTSIKEAVTKVQNVATARNDGETLLGNLPEVLMLCESLDRAFTHGLKQSPYGYWPCVKEFTHHNCRVYLESLQNVTTNIGRGRSWICQALNDNTLESYISSFVENRKILEKHYLKAALLRDNNRMQVVLTLMAGLEFVEFDLTVDSINWDSVGFENSIIKIDLDLEADNLSACSSGLESKSTTHTSATPVSMMSLGEDEPDPLTIESAVEVTDETLLNGDCLPDCSCPSCSFKEELMKQRHRISHLINLDPDKITPNPDDSEDSNLEIVHARVLPVVKIKRKKTSSISSQESNTINNNETVTVTDNESRKNSRCESIDKDCDITPTPQRKMELPLIIDIPNDISNEKLVETPPNLCWLGEREAPEGQEDPDKTLTDFNGRSESVAEVDDAISLKTDPILDHDEEFSIYDGLKTPVTEVNEDPAVFQLDKDVSHRWNSQLSITSSNSNASYEDFQKIEDINKLKEANRFNDRSLEIKNNINLYLVLEVFQEDDEKLYKMFMVSTNHSQGGYELAFVLLSNLTLYLLLPGNCNTGKFKIKTIIPYEKINTITVSLNYQSFVIQCHGGIQKCSIFTGSDFLTRSILSNLELTMRRKGMKELPSMITKPNTHIETLQRELSKELQIEPDNVDLSLYTLVEWENYMGISPVSTPAGPIQEGFLMYIHLTSGVKSWIPAYFQLKAGVLYCYKDSESQNPSFYFQLQYPHFQGCRRVQDADRPYAFELQLRAKEKLLLAAANDLEASNWLQGILQSVALFGKLTDTELKTIHSSAIILANQVFLLLGDKENPYAVLGKANLSDLIAVRVDIDSPTICILEFESGEANTCGGDWILLFADIDEKEKLLSVVSLQWETLFQVPLNVTPLKDLSLWSRCREHFQRQKKSIEEMLALLDINS